MAGVTIVFAAPRQGKTYWATSKAVHALKKGKQKVFTNYPVFYKNKSTLVWESGYETEPITDSLIIIDEAYRYFNSRNYKNFTDEEHFFFATSGQNENDIILIAHSPARLDTVIREIASLFLFVKKITIPLTEYPLWFRTEGYLDEISLSRRAMSKEAFDSVEHHIFRKKIAKAYDTHFFRKIDIPETQFYTWAEKTDVEIMKSSLLHSIRQSFQKLCTFLKCQRKDN